ncbi:MAG: ABC transporter ATP-binding protein [Chloroflexi bacterium]|nr:ABC transporter ATP-binding protein [Chloroflexota bacterium]
MLAPLDGVRAFCYRAVDKAKKAGNSMPGLRLVGITKRFPEVTAVNNFSLDVGSGEFLVLVGPSGCGKTTLLRVIAGLEKPDAGDIYLGGVWANETPVGKRNVQMIFQSYALWPHMKVFDERGYTNLSFPLKVRNWTAESIATWIGEVTRRAGLESTLFSRKPDTLSAGQKQRVALARAMATSPKLFLMDEPITNLDPPARVKVRREIKQLHLQLGATTVYVTHNMADAFAMADRIAIMRDGRLVQVGTEQHLRQHPADEFVQDFLVS